HQDNHDNNYLFSDTDISGVNDYYPFPGISLNKDKSKIKYIAGLDNINLICYNLCYNKKNPNRVEGPISQIIASKNHYNIMRPVTISNKNNKNIHNNSYYYGLTSDESKQVYPVL